MATGASNAYGLYEAAYFSGIGKYKDKYSDTTKKPFV
jgi:hypothetical protein